ncbi:MAG: hypothetical protein NC299_11755 [Lachnospiraceae bacterium]|nr:hypothetical protein [Lachnospiraceae bacterium]
MAEYVSKEAVLPRMEELVGAVLDLLEIDSLDSDDEEAELKNTAVELFNAIPAADVRENRTGFWIQIKGGPAACSECKNWYGNAQKKTDKEFYRKFRYCPFCGARMRKMPGVKTDGEELENG